MYGVCMSVCTRTCGRPRARLNTMWIMHDSPQSRPFPTRCVMQAKASLLATGTASAMRCCRSVNLETIEGGGPTTSTLRSVCGQGRGGREAPAASTMLAVSSFDGSPPLAGGHRGCAVLTPFMLPSDLAASMGGPFVW